jgi:hypothetical protein
MGTRCRRAIRRSASAILGAERFVADPHHLVDDLTPSPVADAPPTRAFEYGEELAVRVTEAGSDLDLRGPRTRLDDPRSESSWLAGPE